MSVESTTDGVVGAADASPGESPGSGQRDLAGVLFARLAAVPALLAAAWLLSGLAFVWAGHFRPVPVTVVAAALAVPLLWFGLRAVPGLVCRTALPGARGRTPWWTLAAVALIAVAFFIQQAAYHSQFVVITRDPGAYFDFAAWLAHHGSLPATADPAAFGGTQGGLLTFNGYATYPQGDGTLILQFMAGLPLTLAGAIWAGGYHAALLMPPLLGAMAVVAFAGVAARLVGPRWAVLATLIVAVSQPMQFTSRSTYSEPLAMLMFLSGLALVLDGLRVPPAASGEGGALALADGDAPVLPGARPSSRARTAAALGGLLLGLTVLVRIDGVADILPVIVYCGAMFVRRRPQAAWLAAALAAGTAAGAAEGLVFSWPYLMQTNRSSVVPLGELTAAVIVATAVATLVFRRRPLPKWRGWLQHAALPAAAAVALVFWARPYVQHTMSPDSHTGQMVRTYQELSLHWAEWYLGIPVVIAATAGAGLLARRCLRGRPGDWTLPLMVLAWSLLVFLCRPAIVADQPWASRRMVPEIIPALVLLAVWAIARAAAWRRAGRFRPALVTVCALAVVLPAVIANWGLGASFSNGTVRLTADGLADKRLYQGQLPALETLCGTLPSKSSVILTNGNLFQQLPETVRSICDVPVASVSQQDLDNHPVMSAARQAEVVRSAVARTERAGRVPVVIAGDEKSLKPFEDGAGEARHVVTLNSMSDPGGAGSFYGVQERPQDLRLEFWTWTPSA